MTDDAAPAAAIGHNNPPDEIGELLAKAEEALAQASRAPEQFQDTDTAGRGVALVKMLRILVDKIDAARKTAEKPHAACIAAIKARVSPKVGELERAKDRLEAAIHAYRVAAGLDRIESDFGPKAYARTVAGEPVIDRAQLPAEFLVVDMKAIRAALKEGRTIPGVTVEDVATTVIV